MMKTQLVVNDATCLLRPVGGGVKGVQTTDNAALIR